MVMSEATHTPSEPAGMPVHNAENLLGEDGRAGLLLNGMLYILRVTKSGKLILTK